MRHVQSLVGADPALRVGLPANSRAVLVVENSRAIRVVCLRVEAALPRVAAPMLEIDLRELGVVAVALRVGRALSRVGGDRRHVGRADVVDRVQGVRALARIERRIHPLLRSLGGTSCVCVGSSWYAGVIQIEILDTRLLLHVDAETGVQPIAGEPLVRQAHGRVVLVDLLCSDLLWGHVKAGGDKLLVPLTTSTRPLRHASVTSDLCLD